jgi:hypothetical protein
MVQHFGNDLTQKIQAMTPFSAPIVGEVEFTSTGPAF